MRENIEEARQGVEQIRYWSIDCVFGHPSRTPTSSGHRICPDRERDIFPPCDCTCHKRGVRDALRLIDGGKK